jgi:hypothetical protein
MDIPTFAEIFRIAPIVAILVGVISLGFIVGYRSRSDHIKSLVEMLKDLRRK